MFSHVSALALKAVHVLSRQCTCSHVRARAITSVRVLTRQCTRSQGKIIIITTTMVKVPVKGKETKFLYSAVSNPQDCSKRFTLYFPDRPVQSNTMSTFLGSIQPYATISARRLLVHPPLFIAGYTLIQLSELEQCRMKKLPKVLTPQDRIQTRVLLVATPKLYP